MNASIDKDTSVPAITITLMMLVLAVAYIAGLFPDVMETDAAQYASISREMADTGNYLQVFHRGQNYLDKPPLLFWLSSFTIQAFGNSAWAYKLPSFLFTILGLWSVFRFTLIYYARKTAWFAFFILASCQAWFLFNNDVRTDTLLAGAVIFSVWQIARYLEYRNVWGLILGGVGIAAAMLAKGPIGIMAPALAVGSHLIFSRRLKMIINPGWLLMLLVIAGLLVPMCYGLYKQYGMEGLEFFFWKQSFGRITGENEWRNDAGYFYFLHTFPWAFMPWSLLAIPALFFGIARLVKNKFKTGKSLPETISVFGFVLPFIALSFSHYKLPHYIFVTFPFAAIFSARFLYDAIERQKKPIWVWISLIPGVLALPIISLLACGYVFEMGREWLYIALSGLVLTGLALYFGRGTLFPIEKLFLLIVMCGAWANVAMNTLFYTKLLSYQPGKAAAEWIQQQGEAEHAAMYYLSDHPIEFYAARIFPDVASGNVKQYLDQYPNAYFYTDEQGLEDMKRFGYNPQVVKFYPRHHPALLTINFLNPKTRETSLGYRYWVTLKQ